MIAVSTAPPRGYNMIPIAAAMTLALASAGLQVPPAGVAYGTAPIDHASQASHQPQIVASAEEKVAAELLTNNPLGSPAQRRALLDDVVRRVRQQQAGDVIRFLTYQIHDTQVTRSLLRAHRRGVDVRIVMNRTAYRKGTDERRLRSVLGTDPTARSFAIAPYDRSMHMKLYAFSRGSSILVGSSNLTNWRHWNHLVQLTSNVLHARVATRFATIARGDGFGYHRIRVGNVDLHMFPGTADPVRAALQRFDGRRAHVQMFTWGKARGERMTDELLAAAARSCSMRIVANTGVPWSTAVRRAHRGGLDVLNTRVVTSNRAYPHDKLLVLDNLVLTGSDNWKHSHRGHFETVVAIRDAGLAKRLRRHVRTTRHQALAGRHQVAPPRGWQLTPAARGLRVTWPSAQPWPPGTAIDVSVRRPGQRGCPEQSLRVPAAGPIDTKSGSRYASIGGLAAETSYRVAARVVLPDGRRSQPVHVLAATYDSRADAPVVDRLVAVSPTAARLRLAASAKPTSPPPRVFEVRTRAGGAPWGAPRQHPVAGRLDGLVTDAKTHVQARVIPVEGSPSRWSKPAAVEPTARPAQPRRVRAVPTPDGQTRLRWREPLNTGVGGVSGWRVRYRLAEDRRWTRVRVDDPATRAVRIPGSPAADVVARP
jgi:hypothetical protein